MEIAGNAIEARGPGGEELTIDVALRRSSAGEATSALLVSSGLHGVEGLFGSAVQAAWPEVKGVIAEDATLFLATANHGDQKLLLHRLNNLQEQVSG